MRVALGMPALGRTRHGGSVLLLAVLTLVACPGAGAVWLCPPGCRDREVIERGRCLCGTEGLFLDGTKQVGDWAEVMYLSVAPRDHRLADFPLLNMNACSAKHSLFTV